MRRRYWTIGLLLVLVGVAVTWHGQQRRERAQQTEALFAAIEDQQPRVVERLLAAGASPLSRDGLGVPALHRAAERGNLEVLVLLLQRGTGIDVRDPSQRTPLMCAAGSNRVLALRELLTRGADPNARGPQGWTPLHYAANKGSAQAIRSLLAAGARPSARRSDGVTPLHLAATTGAAESVRSLLAGNTANRFGVTPLLCAVRSLDPKTVEALLASGARVEGPALTQAAAGSRPLLALLSQARDRRTPASKVFALRPPAERRAPRRIASRKAVGSPVAAAGVSVPDLARKLPAARGSAVATAPPAPPPLEPREAPQICPVAYRIAAEKRLVTHLAELAEG